MTAALRPYRWLRAHPLSADLLGAVVLATLAVASLWMDRPGDIPTGGVADPDAIGVALTLLSTLPIALRRRGPLAVLTVTGVANISANVFGYHTGLSGLGVLVALYSVAAHADRRDSVIAAGITVAGITVAIAMAPTGVPAAAFVGNYVLFAIAWVVGDSLRNRRAYVAALEERAEHLERSRAEESRAAVATERARIARELHDVVAHSMSVMVVQAGAARRVIAHDQDGAVEALASIEGVGRRALDELRRSLGVLRDEGGDSFGTTPLPSVADLDHLVTQTSEAGLDVDFTIEGEPRPVPAGVGLSAYRIVQEALTNALRHAGPATATVRLRYGPEDIELEVRDDGRGAASALDGGGPAGHGLLGMRERVQLFDGELRVGDRPGGGFGVWARIPVSTT